MIYAVGRVNFLFDRSRKPHLRADQLADLLGVVKTTMANRAALINKTLGIGVFEPDLTCTAVLEQHPLTRIVEVNGFLVDARTLPPDLMATKSNCRASSLVPMNRCSAESPRGSLASRSTSLASTQDLMLGRV